MIKTATLLLKNEHLDFVEYFLLFVFDEELPFQDRERLISYHLRAGNKVIVNHDRLIQDSADLICQFGMMYDKNEIQMDLEDYEQIDFIHSKYVSIVLVVAEI